MVSQSYRDKNGSFVTGRNYAYEMEYDGWSFADEEYFTATDYSELRSRFATSADRSR